MSKQRKNIFHWSGVALTYLAFGLALLVNSHVLSVPTDFEQAAHILKNQSDSEKNTPISDQEEEDGTATLQASSVLEAVVNASVLPLDSQLFDLICFDFPVIEEFAFLPEIVPAVLPYWQNTFGHIIVINGP